MKLEEVSFGRGDIKTPWQLPGRPFVGQKSSLDWTDLGSEPETVQNTVQQAGDGVHWVTWRIEETGYRAQEITQKVAGARDCGDVQLDRRQVNLQAENVKEDRTQVQEQDLAASRLGVRGGQLGDGSGEVLRNLLTINGSGQCAAEVHDVVHYGGLEVRQGAGERPTVFQDAFDWNGCLLVRRRGDDRSGGGCTTGGGHRGTSAHGGGESEGSGCT